MSAIIQLFIVIVIVAVAAVLLVIYIVNSTKSNKHCGPSCAGCPIADNCKGYKP